MSQVAVVYRVFVDNATNTFTGTPGSDDYGFADWWDARAYIADGTPPSDNTAARVKELAAARWRRIVRMLCTLGSPLHLIPISRGIGSANTVPDFLHFEVAWPGADEPRITDRFAPGSVLIGTPAVTRAVAEGLAHDFPERLFVPDMEVHPGMAASIEDVRVRTPLSGDEQTRVTTAESSILVTRVT